MLVLARESRGLTQSELAVRASISQGFISKYENGVLEVSADVLTRLAKCLDYPERFFYQDFRRSGLNMSFVFHRKRASLAIHTLRKIEAQVNIQAGEVGRLLSSVDADCGVSFASLDIADYGGDASHIAQLVRANWRLPVGPVANVIGAIEAAGGIVLRRSFDTDKIDGLSYWLGEVPMFFVNAANPGDRSRFSLAHEIGHIVMHRVPTPNLEDEANEFASEFLMPKEEIAADLEGLTLQRAAALKSVWKVSMAAVIRRAFTLKKITANQYRRFCMQMSQLGYRVREPNPIPMEDPTACRKILEVHQRDLKYSLSDLANALCLHPHELQEKYFPTQAQMRLVH